MTVPRFVTIVTLSLLVALLPSTAQDSGNAGVTDAPLRVDMKASKYEFSPATVRVRAGTPVELHVTATDGAHGIAIPGLRVSERLPRGREVVITFTAAAGRYPFRCSVFCGSGHGDMHGELIVE
jgi:cytochrome c oxidase subunit 2